MHIMSIRRQELHKPYWSCPVGVHERLRRIMSVFFVLLGHDRLLNGWNDPAPTQTPLYPARRHPFRVSPNLTLQYPRTIFEP